MALSAVKAPPNWGNWFWQARQAEGEAVTNGQGKLAAWSSTGHWESGSWSYVSLLGTLLGRPGRHTSGEIQGQTD